jgi:mRNA-degrading endonuclease YafQ of YafQ-DinJ toxin-antitoxin module
MSPREVQPPGEPYRGRHRVWATRPRAWQKLCQAVPGAMEAAYRELADNPFPPGNLRRHHQLKGRLKGHWEYEVTGGGRIRYKRGPDGDPVVTYAGSAPSDTH